LRSQPTLKLVEVQVSNKEDHRLVLEAEVELWGATHGMMTARMGVGSIDELEQTQHDSSLLKQMVIISL